MDLSLLNKKLELTPELRTLGLRVGLGLLLLAVAAYVMVYMSLREDARLTGEIIDVREGTRRQQLLIPAWATIASLSHNASLEAVSLPAPEPVPRTRVYLMPEQLEHMARAVGVEPLEVTLNPASMGQDPSSIQAQGMFSGSLEGVRALLMDVARMPSLARLERVELRAVDGRLELFLKLRFALAN
ncbi:MAG: hypothetical protein CVU73_13380 [Deltaproteobacteria bacterium HGW-Deltaproteobacteria-8]|jgi:hypothetical protein|nr:MAG: hypothetical protein CVU73_13380 [Deltaproteobacteria bacterium HGW-Deltaproteobacteria-8]